jgi:acyl carrier protein
MEGIRVRRDQLPLARAYAEPRTALEQSLAEIWRQTLALDRVGVEDDYDELGGDSVSAAIIFTQIESRFGVTLPISTLVDAPTIAQLAAVIAPLPPVK